MEKNYRNQNGGINRSVIQLRSCHEPLLDPDAAVDNHHLFH